MTPLETNKDIGPTRLHTITVHKKSHHAVTSNVGKYTPNYLNITEQIAKIFIKHAKECDSAACELDTLLKEFGVEKSC